MAGTATARPKKPGRRATLKATAPTGGRANSKVTGRAADVEPDGRAEPRFDRAGTRVLIRLPRQGDRDEVLAVRRSNRVHLRPWYPRGQGTPEIWWERFLSGCIQPDARRFLIVLEERAPPPARRRAVRGAPARGRIVGAISLGGILRGPLNSCFVGYWLAQDAVGRGIMSRAIRLALDFAFRTLRLHRVEANIMPHNARSKATVSRLGFRFEGLALRYLQIAGRYEDHEHWAMTIEDWRALRASWRAPGGPSA